MKQFIKILLAAIAIYFLCVFSYHKGREDGWYKGMDQGIDWESFKRWQNTGKKKAEFDPHWVRWGWANKDSTERDP
jgi:hypothetical protein